MAAMLDPEYRFEDWVLCPTRRELDRAGMRVTLEPRVFDLLVCLVRHHTRVVRKDELLDAVWPGEPVSVGVIARAVMKARQALGDNDRAGRLIRTVPRVGYRFVAPVTRPSTAAPVPAPPAAAASAATVALLPFQNRTGRAEFDWVELGLMSLTVKALGGDPRLAVASVASVLHALGRAPKDADERACVDALRAALGVQHVVRVAVRAAADGFALDLAVHGGDTLLQRQLAGADLPALGNAVANWLERALLADRARPLPATCAVADPFAARALVRGLQAAAEQRWQEASNLLRVVLDAEPQAREIELEYLRALAPLGDDRALALGERLLAEAHATADMTRVADVQQAIGRTYLNKGLHEPAKLHLDAAIRLASGEHDADTRALTLLLRATIAVEQRDFGLARQLLRDAQPLCEPRGNLAYRLWRQISLGIVRWRLGDLAGGYEDICRAVQLSSSHRLRRDHAATSENQARLALHLGRIADAGRSARLALELADEVADPYTMSFAAETLCLLARLTERPGEGAEALARLARRAGAKLPGVEANTAMARGHQAWSEGRMADAVSDMSTALEHYARANEWLTAHDVAPWLVWACLEAGDAATARGWIERIDAFPGASADRSLQAVLGWLRARTAETGAGLAASAVLPRVQQAADAVPPGLWQGLIGLDLVQRLLDAGDRAEATRRSNRLSVWIEGLAAGRRLATALERVPG